MAQVKLATKNKSKDTVNHTGVFYALIPLLLSLFAVGAWLNYSQSPDNKTYKIGADRRGSDNYELLTALADQSTNQAGDIRLKVFQTAGSGESIKLLEDGIIDFASVPADAISRPNLSMAAVLYPDTYHLVVRRDASIKSVPDLVGKRIGLPSINSSQYRSFWYIIDQYTVQPERFTTLPLGTEASFQALRSRKIDALFVMSAPGNRRLKWLADAAQIDILEIDQAAAMQVKRPALQPAILSKGTYSGTPALPARDIATVATDRILITRPNVPENVVRQVTATLFENQRELSLSSRLAGFVHKPNFTGATLLPIHPGAMAFYNRDQPSFLQENAEPIGVGISAAAILISVLLWLKRRWEESQKGRVDVYNLDLLKITEAARASTTLDELAQHKADLFTMLDEVVNDLDKDKIDGEGFQYFAFTWRVALDAIVHRETDLSAGATKAL
jgi:TRAP transporter TAXI family solute receptor